MHLFRILYTISSSTSLLHQNVNKQYNNKIYPFSLWLLYVASISVLWSKDIRKSPISSTESSSPSMYTAFGWAAMYSLLPQTVGEALMHTDQNTSFRLELTRADGKMTGWVKLRGRMGLWSTEYSWSMMIAQEGPSKIRAPGEEVSQNNIYRGLGCNLVHLKLR